MSSLPKKVRRLIKELALLELEVDTSGESDVNDPSASEKAALDAASSPAGGNPFVTESFLSDVLLSFVLDADPRLSNARTPTSHKTSHEPGGLDALNALDNSSIATGAGIAE